MLRKLVSRRTLALVSGTTAVAAAGGYYYLNSGPTYTPSTKETRRPPQPWTPPSRQQMLDALKASDDDPSREFDLLIVGGGATGAGVAVDAASRGLKVALVERDDFSSGEYCECCERASAGSSEKTRFPTANPLIGARSVRLPRSIRAAIPYLTPQAALFSHISHT